MSTARVEAFSQGFQRRPGGRNDLRQRDLHCLPRDPDGSRRSVDFQIMASVSALGYLFPRPQTSKPPQIADLRSPRGTDGGCPADLRRVALAVRQAGQQKVAV